jgi:hypothetical protein
MMTEKFAKIRPEWTVSETLEHLKTIDPEVETIQTIYAVDGEDHLVGAVPLRRLLAQPLQLRRFLKFEPAIGFAGDLVLQYVNIAVLVAVDEISGHPEQADRNGDDDKGRYRFEQHEPADEPPFEGMGSAAAHWSSLRR